MGSCVCTGTLALPPFSGSGRVQSMAWGGCSSRHQHGGTFGVRQALQVLRHCSIRSVSGIGFLCASVCKGEHVFLSTRKQVARPPHTRAAFTPALPLPAHAAAAAQRWPAVTMARWRRRATLGAELPAFRLRESLTWPACPRRQCTAAGRTCGSCSRTRCRTRTQALPAVCVGGGKGRC